MNFAASAAHYPRTMTEADDEATEQATSRKPRKAGFSYHLGRAVIGPIARLIYRPRIEGREHVPTKGPVIFASNHLSLIDTIAIPIAAPRAVHFMAKSSLVERKGLTGAIHRAFFNAIGAVPVKRGAGQAALEALDQQRQLLEDGRAVALFPEGSRSIDGRLYKGRTGVAFLALQTGALVVPVGLIGTDKMMPVGSKAPSFGVRITVRFGAPLDVSQFGPADSGKARRLATDAVMAAIHELTGQELADGYLEIPA